MGRFGSFKAVADMSGVQTVAVEEDADGMRLDRWVKKRFPGLNQGRVEKLLRTGQIRLDGRGEKRSIYLYYKRRALFL